MHELSIARSLIEIACEEAKKRHLDVQAVHVKIGVLSGVVTQALLFAYDIAVENTPLSGTRLVVEEAPVRVFCHSCKVESTLEGMQNFACSKCGAVSGDLRGGQELNLTSLEVKD